MELVCRPGRQGRCPRPARRTRIGRIRWWLRTGALLAILGVLWLARAARSHWEPVFLVAGAVVTVAGVVQSAAGAFFLGLLVLIVTLLKGVARNGTPTNRRGPH